ncbi:MAG TPA: hypothetical protein VEU51_09875 [Candidatus Acidoferrales bacterium]|nr:hypothetical protein [Candidatus Acidoferrales bacterium]
MSTFTKQFSSADDYEDWLKGVGERVHVLTISTNASAVRNLSEPRSTVYTPRKGTAVVVKYETRDKSLAPKKSKFTSVIQIVAIGVVFWALFIYAIRLLM